LEGEKLLAGPGVPELDRPIGAGGGQRLAIGAEADPGDGEDLTFQGEDLLPPLHLPDLQLCAAGGGEALAVGAEADTAGRAGVPLELVERVKLLAGPGLPELVRAGAGGGGARAVGGEAAAPGRAGVVLEGGHLLPRPDVPELLRLVAAGGGEACAVGAEA